MVAPRFAVVAVVAASLLLPAALLPTASAEGVDGFVPLNQTTAGEVPAGGAPSTMGILLPAGLQKGSLQVKLVKGSALRPEVSFVHPDGTAYDGAALGVLGARVKVAKKGVTISSLPTLEESGLYRVVVAGADGDGGLPTSGGFTLRVKGKPSKGLKTPVSSIGTLQETDDYLLSVPQGGELTLKLKPGKKTPFGVTLAILTGSGDEVSTEGFVKVGKDDSISIRKLPLPFFGDYTLRVGSRAGTGSYTLQAKVKASKSGPPAGVPVADAGGSVLVEPGGTAVLDGSGSSGAATLLWSQVGGPPVALSSTSAVKPTLTAPEGRVTAVFQLVGRNAAGTSAPDTALLEVDRVPVADAGPSLHLDAPAPVTLDGSGSFDPDEGDTLAFAWSQAAGPSVALDDPSSEGPSFTPAADGLYAFELTVSDGTASSEPSRVLVAVGSSSAVADAGRNVLVRPHDTVFLSGLRSRSSSGGAPSTFAWTADGGNEAAVTLSGADGPVASFTAPKVPARLRFRLAVDGTDGAADEVVVVVTRATPANGSPSADAGTMQAVGTSSPFTLDGSDSVDDGVIQEFTWLQTGGPDAGLVDGGTTAAGTSPGSDAVMSFLLMAFDGRKYGAPDSVSVVGGTRILPVADAGDDRSGNPGAVLTLSSSTSMPSQGGTISTRLWTQLSGRDWYDIDAMDGGFDPAAASPAVTVPDTVSSLVPDRQVLMALEVTDGAGTSAPCYAVLTFTNLPTNARPSVDASADDTVYRPGETVNLTALVSDPDGDPVATTWSQVSGPTVLIGNGDTTDAYVTAPMATVTLVFRATVDDGTGEDNATNFDEVTVSVNQPPVVTVESTPASGPAGTEVTLGAGGTTDPDDETLTFAWTEIPPPVGGPVTLSGADTDTASFTMPAYTGSPGQRTRTFRVTVTDSMGPSHAVEETVQFLPNLKPVLNDILAGGDRVIFYSNSGASSDKSESLTAGPAEDADGDNLTFSWTLKSGPLTQSGLLSATSGKTVTFGAPKPVQSQNSTGGVYVIGVMASDGIALSDEKTISVVVTASWASDIYPLITSGCTSSSCHGSTTQGGLDLRFSAKNALYGINSGGTYSNPTGSSLLTNGRVVANNHSSSVFWSKLQSGSMPKNATPWGPHLYNMVRDWIEPEHNATSKPGLTTGAEDN